MAPRRIRDPFVVLPGAIAATAITLWLLNLLLLALVPTG